MISVFCTSIRPERWPTFYRNISEATTRPFEIVVTSPCDAGAPVPDNFRVIKTAVKPSQAMEAAARACRGEMVIDSRDDLFYEPGTLDELATILESGDKLMATPTYWCNGGYGPDFHKTSPVGYVGMSPQSPLLWAKDWKDAGGIDPMFCSQYGDDDLFQRLMVAGWKTILSLKRQDEFWQVSDLWAKSGNKDLAMLRGIWQKDGKFTGVRSVAPASYVDATILTENQGFVRGSAETRWS